jgi:hypothetical protein
VGRSQIIRWRESLILYKSFNTLYAGRLTAVLLVKEGMISLERVSSSSPSWRDTQLMLRGSWSRARACSIFSGKGHQQLSYREVGPLASFFDNNRYGKVCSIFSKKGHHQFGMGGGGGNLTKCKKHNQGP